MVLPRTHIVVLVDLIRAAERVLQPNQISPAVRFQVLQVGMECPGAVSRLGQRRVEKLARFPLLVDFERLGVLFDLGNARLSGARLRDRIHDRVRAEIVDLDRGEKRRCLRVGNAVEESRQATQINRHDFRVSPKHRGLLSSRRVHPHAYAKFPSAMLTLASLISSLANDLLRNSRESAGSSVLVTMLSTMRPPESGSLHIETM